MAEIIDEIFYPSKDIQTERTGSDDPDHQRKFVSIMMKQGENFYWSVSQPLRALKERVTEERTALEVTDDQIAFIFLDRDGRAAMHAWQTLTENRFKSFPLPLSNAQFPQFSRDFETFMLQQKGKTYEEFSKVSEEVFIKSYESSYQQEFDVWRKALLNTIKGAIEGKRLIYLVDIGFNGSMIELAKYLLKEEIDLKKVRPILLFGNKDTVVPFLEEGISTGKERSMPHATIGYALTNDARYRYKRELGEPTRLENAFMKGVKKAAVEDLVV